MQALAARADPLERIVSLAREVMAAAADEGVAGPPFDPLDVAKLMGLRLQPRADISDARVVVDRREGQPRTAELDAPLASLVPAREQLVVEYNPTRPRGRMRYSIAHELAHALFPDVAEAPRHRTGTGAVPQDDDSWQLEMLCNVAAAEMLMPTEAVEGLAGSAVDIDYFMDQRQRFEVSTEALLRRITTVSDRPLAMLALLRSPDRPDGDFRIEYVVTSRTFAPKLRRGSLISPPSPLRNLTAVGQTMRLDLTVDEETYHAQAVGSPPYSGRSLPRGLALLEPLDTRRVAPPGLRYVTGDIAQPYTDARPVVIAHITNDTARAWGGRGVAKALALRYPSAKAAYRAWVVQSGNLALGNAHVVAAAENPAVHIASLLAQSGYGPDRQSRLMYRALGQALATLGDYAEKIGARVFLPRLGTGQAGGRWDLVEAELDEALLRRHLEVTVFTLPSRTR